MSLDYTRPDPTLYQTYTVATDHGFIEAGPASLMRLQHYSAMNSELRAAENIPMYRHPVFVNAAGEISNRGLIGRANRANQDGIYRYVVCISCLIAMGNINPAWTLGDVHGESLCLLSCVVHKEHGHGGRLCGQCIAARRAKHGCLNPPQYLQHEVEDLIAAAPEYNDLLLKNRKSNLASWPVADRNRFEFIAQLARTLGDTYEA